jgi:P27 family predicted phage terminase small subunit
MGKRGFLPAAPQLKLLCGNAHKGSTAKLKEEAKKPFGGVEPGVPDCPPDLDPEAQAEWNRISKELVAAYRLAPIDRAILICHCRTWSIVKHLDEIIDEARRNGEPYLTEAKLRQQQVRLLVQIDTQLGLTPASRIRNRIEQADDTTDDEFDI